MYEFQWTLPGEQGDHDLRLRIHSRNSWIGRKVLLLDGNRLYTRDWFDGINHVFPHPEDPNRSLILQAVPEPEMRRWQPQLTLEGAILPECTGNSPPPVPHRTRLLAVVTGLTYLIMLMVLIMLPHAWRMLEAGFGHSDTSTVILDVVGPGHGASQQVQFSSDVPQRQPEGPTITIRLLPQAREGVLYEARLLATGGVPFEGEYGGPPHYRWLLNKRKLPKGLRVDENTGMITGTPLPQTAGSYPMTVRVLDNAYTPLTHIAPWIAPFVVTAVCMLGFWNMRRWSVILFAILILAQLVLGVTDVWHAWMPLNITGLILQSLVFATGARSFSAMR